MTVWTFLLAAAGDSGSGTDLTVFAQYGVLGVVAVLLIWFAKSAHQRERDRADAAEAENRQLLEQRRETERANRAEAETHRLHELIIERVIPAVAAAGKAAEESAAILAAIQRERELAALTQQRRGPEGGN